MGTHWERAEDARKTATGCLTVERMEDAGKKRGGKRKTNNNDLQLWASEFFLSSSPSSLVLHQRQWAFIAVMSLLAHASVCFDYGKRQKELSKRDTYYNISHFLLCYACLINKFSPDNGNATQACSHGRIVLHLQSMQFKG